MDQTLGIRVRGTILGLSLLALACSSGAKGTKTSDAGPDAPPRMGHQVFDESKVQSYYLTFTDEEYARLMDFSTLLSTPYEVNEDRYVKAALRIGDSTLPVIGVRFKGNYSIWGCIDYAAGERVKRVEPFFGNVDVCQRFSFKLDIDRYDDHLRLDGLKKLNLHAMAADPSKLRERLGYSLFRDMGIPAPRVAHVRLFINGTYHGLFAAVEEVDGRFTADRFPSAGDGNLYRDLWPSAGLSEAAALQALRTNDEPDVANVSDFMAFSAAVSAATDTDFAAKVGPHVDFDQLARYIVVDRAIANSDGIMAFYSGPGWGPANQNYFWYDSGAGRFTLLPWDLDKSLWYPEPNFWSDNAANGLNIVPNWNVVTRECMSYTCHFDSVRVVNGVVIPLDYNVSAVDCDPFLKLLRAQVYEGQKAIADDFLAGPFSEANVRTKLETWRTQIADAIREDASTDSKGWSAAVDDLLANVPKFRANLRTTMGGLITD